MYSPCPTRGQKEPHTPAHTSPTQRRPGQEASARTQAQRAGSWAWDAKRWCVCVGGGPLQGSSESNSGIQGHLGVSAQHL